MPITRSKTPPKPPRPPAREGNAARGGAARSSSRTRANGAARSAPRAEEFRATSVRPHRLSITDLDDEASERETLPAPAPTRASELAEPNEAERSSMPELVFSETTAGPEFMELVTSELGAEPDIDPGAAAVELLELVTFLARGSGLEQLNSEKARRSFVERRLLHRLPVRSMADVDHVDLAPWTVENTLVVRVWCKIAAPG